MGIASKENLTPAEKITRILMREMRETDVIQQNVGGEEWHPVIVAVNNEAAKRVQAYLEKLGAEKVRTGFMKNGSSIYPDVVPTFLPQMWPECAASCVFFEPSEKLARALNDIVAASYIRDLANGRMNENKGAITLDNLGLSPDDLAAFMSYQPQRTMQQVFQRERNASDLSYHYGMQFTLLTQPLHSTTVYDTVVMIPPGPDSEKRANELAALINGHMQKPTGALVKPIMERKLYALEPHWAVVIPDMWINKGRIIGSKDSDDKAFTDAMRSFGATTRAAEIAAGLHIGLKPRGRAHD